MINWNETLRTAHISGDGLYRYTLSRVWDRTLPMVLWVMLNPSTADGRQDDRTIRKIGKFSDGFGFGGMWVGNLFAFRSKEPEDLKYRVRAGLQVIGSENDKHLNAMASKSKKIIFGWGANANDIDQVRVTKVIDMFPKSYALTINQDNSPGHPLFTKGTTKLFLYNAGPSASY